MLDHAVCGGKTTRAARMDDEFGAALRAAGITQGGKSATWSRAEFPAVAGAVPHALRANAVIRLRQGGYSAPHISDMIGMSPPIVERCCRHAGRKAGLAGA